MGRILKTDLYRTFHGLAFYVFPAALLLILILSLTLGDAAGMTMSVEGILEDTFVTARYLTFMPLGFLVTYLWNTETRNGFIKNIAGNVTGRHIPAVTKLVTGALITVIYMIITIGFMLVGNLLNGYTIVWGDPGRSIAKLGLWILIGMAFVALMELVHELTHSAALGYILTIAIWTGMVEELILNIVALIDSKIDLIGYTLIYGMLIEDRLWVSLIRTIVYLAVFAVLAVFTAKKRDVKA